MTTRLTAREMAAGVRTGELSAAELVADALSAAAALDPVLHFMDSLAPDSALEAAVRIDALPLGQRDGLSLAGVPFLAKAGTTVASPVVGRLVHTGAVLLGTTTRPDPGAICQAWVTVPAGLLDGLPVGFQAVAAPHRDDLAVELAGLAEVSLPDPPVHWPVARG